MVFALSAAIPVHAAVVGDAGEEFSLLGCIPIILLLSRSFFEPCIAY